MKILYSLIPMLITPLAVTSVLNDIDFFSLDSLSSYKKIDIDFDNNKIINTITNKEYTSINNTYKLVDSLKGNGFNSNNDYFTVPFSDVGINSSTDITVSFLFKWGGQDNIFPMTTNTLGLWFKDNKIGFNVGNSVLYGIENTIKPGEIVQITTVLTPSNPRNCKLYINGVKQTLTDYGTNPMPTTLNGLGDKIWLGGYNGLYDYVPKDNTMIDEIKVYQKNITDAEAIEVANLHKVPILRGEVINNSYPKLSWATEILQENILWQIGYEEDEQSGIRLVYDSANGLGTGGQEFKNNESFTGKYSIYTPNSYPDKGNLIAWPYTARTINNHIYYINKKIGLENGIPISTSFRIKGEGNISAKIYSDWEYINTFRYYNATYLEDYPVGTTKIKVSNYSLFSLGSHITVDPDVYKHEINNSVRVMDDTTQTLTLSKPLNYAVKAGDKIKYRANSTMIQFPVLSTTGTGKWELFNLNSIVANPANYNWNEHPVILRQYWSSNQYAYMDDLTVGHATKVKLYRDNNLIYEGYESLLNDTNAKDTTSPTSVSEINSTMETVNATNSTRKIKVTFKEGVDNGTIYNYQVSAVSKDNVETPLSETNQQTVTSGVKGYSYVIDKNDTTIPDNTVDTTSTTITKDITDSGVYYLHIKTVDNAGNVSGTVHYKIDIPTLTAKANPSEDSIKLDWTMNDLKNKSFKVYKKKDGEANFQSISMTNLDTSKQVRVLNIYPTYNVPLKTDGSVDLNNKPMNQSAMLNDWIKDYGMGIITVDSINKEDFENNPNKWLKDANGDYKYDVVVVGFWNISVRQQHLNNTGSDAIGEFIDSGRGVLAGHHHIGYREFDYGLNRLKTKFGVKLIKEQGAYQTELGNIDYVLPEKSPGSDNSYYWNLGTQVKATKKGILLNYPHNIAQEGKLFTVPKGHDTWEFAMGDVWMQYVNQNSYVSPYNLPAKDITILPDGSAGTSNVYLHTYNNTAIIQTGHSNNVATEDEKKIVANTIFYLNQLSTENFLNDNSGQDVTAPNKPVITGHSFTSRGKVDVKFNEVTDIGTNYSYYVQSEDRNGQISISNTTTDTITSGLNGYSYIVDSNPNSIPDATIELATVQNITVSITDNSPKYVHIRAIDNVGNASETYHYKITETTKPIMNITGNPTSWTNEDVALKITADDLDSGIDYIVLPNGNMVAGENATYIITTNGNYTFKAVDKMGNITNQTVVVNKIDKTSPTITTNKVVNSTKTSANISLTINDTLSGVKYLELPNGTQITNTTSYTFTTIENGLYPFTVYDNIGNKTTVTVEVFELNANIYPSSVARIEYKLSGATIKDWTTYTGEFYITNEGITTITSRSYDKAGNISIEKTSIVKIDKTIPNNSSILINLK